jgi:hypothetical protein
MLSLGEESRWKGEVLASMVECKPENKLEDLNLKCDKYELESAYVDGSIISCVEENKGELYVAKCDAYSKPVRMSFDMNLTTLNILNVSKTMDMDEGKLHCLKEDRKSFFRQGIR